MPSARRRARWTPSRAPTAEVLGEHVLAVGHAPGPALPAGAAVGGGEHHVVAGTDSGDRPAHLLDDPGALVTQDGGQGCRGATVSDDGVGVADSGRHHPDPDLVVADLVELELFQAQRGTVLARDRCGDRRHRRHLLKCYERPLPFSTSTRRGQDLGYAQADEHGSRQSWDAQHDGAVGDVATPRSVEAPLRVHHDRAVLVCPAGPGRFEVSRRLAPIEPAVAVHIFLSSSVVSCLCRARHSTI